MRGSQNLTGKVEKIRDHEDLVQVRRQARKVNIHAFIVGILMTIITIVIP